MNRVASALPAALRQTEEVLTSNPAEAARRAEAILKTAPRHPGATLLLASARRRQGAASDALGLLGPLAKADRRNAVIWYEIGECLTALGRTAEAAAALRRAVCARPDIGFAWRALGDVLFLLGDPKEADEAYCRYIAAPIGESLIAEAAAALARGDAKAAEASLRRHLAGRPHDVKALAVLADALTRQDAFAEAAVLLEAALERNPGNVAARHCKAYVQLRLNQPTMDVVADVREVLRCQPGNADAWALLGRALAALGDADGSIEAFGTVLAARPNAPADIVFYADQLKHAGRRDEAISAFKRAIAADPLHGEAWFRLGDVKTYRFSSDEEAEMRRLSAMEKVKPDQRVFFRYALARARADVGDPAQAFADYAAGAASQCALTPYNAEISTGLVRRSKALFTRDFFAVRAESGRQDPDPIFIVGMPRAGSTLVEQILASHSEVEGTTELPYIGLITARVQATLRTAPYPDFLPSLAPSDVADLGEAYLDAARGHRKLGRPRFIDKMPENFQHIGFIHLILPNARIIDVRRNPMASGFAIYRQHFGEGRRYSYDLKEIGLFYRDYVDLMACFDRALPGRVHRVIYDDLVTNTEAEIRRLLDHCGLPFEPACLNFHENSRAVMTPSAEQVRQPIFTEGIDQWRAYEPWLGPLKEGLGPALERWRGDEIS